jgi:hypothetical protein
MENSWLVIYGAGLGAFIFVVSALPAVWSANQERRKAVADLLKPVLPSKHRRKARIKP